MDNKKQILDLIKQIVDIETTKDFHYRQLLEDKGIICSGESPVIFHLGVLKELIEDI